MSTKCKNLLLSATVKECLKLDEGVLSGKVDTLGTKLGIARKSGEKIIIDFLKQKGRSSKWGQCIDYSDHLTDGEIQTVDLYIKDEFFDTELFGSSENAWKELIKDWTSFLAEVIEVNENNIVGEQLGISEYAENPSVVSASNELSVLTTKLQSDCLIQVPGGSEFVANYSPQTPPIVEEDWIFEEGVIGKIDELTHSKFRVLILPEGTVGQIFANFEESLESELHKFLGSQEIAIIKVRGTAPSPNPMIRDCTSIDVISITVLQKNFPGISINGTPD